MPRSRPSLVAARCVVLVGLIHVIATLPVGAQSPGRPLAIEDFYRLKMVGAPELSPDARWVAFTVMTRVEETNATPSEVWLVPASGASAARRVSATNANATAPRWLDDGRLAFTVSGREVRIDPANPERVDTGAVQAGATVEALGGRGRRFTMQTSPDGKWEATLRSVVPPRTERTYASDFEKRHAERFKGVIFDWLEFQRDGAQFPVPDPRSPESNPAREIWVASSGGGLPRQITHLGLQPAGMQWSADGNLLVFSADSTYRNEHVYGRSDIWTVTRDGKLTRLTTNTEYDYDGPSFSPDGKWIVALRQTPTDVVIAKKMDNGGPVDVVLLPVAGGPERVLTADWDYLPASPEWSADGKYVYFTGGIGGTTHLFRVAPSGGTVEQVTKGERRLTSLSFDRRMTMVAYLVGRIEAPAEIYVARIDGSGERQLTHVHDDFTRDIGLSRAERIQYTSKDGTPIEGWLLLPYGYRANGGPYPLVVSNHGGPHSAVGYDFNFKNQYFAANGYAVLEVNFRSSTGYGEKFLWGTWGAWGFKDGEDVMSGISYVIAHFAIDAKRVATVGHSYGGFMTNWLITQYPDRFAAAIPGAGISDWISDYGTADIARTKETEFYGTPWDPKARELLLRSSPLIYADRVKTPTLFIHGEVDQRVPYSEGEQMYVALKKNGVPAKMIQYAGMPHSISGSWNMVHRMLNERAWLDRYLK
jgi:dipeptidyl aminopeptidase/acylaminoacyl peptidase